MRKDELEAFVMEAKIEKGIAAGVRLRCYGVWSIAATAVAGVSSWISTHFEPVKIGFEAFWAALWKH